MVTTFLVAFAAFCIGNYFGRKDAGCRKHSCDENHCDLCPDWDNV
jgi:hypothetical protein